jgi:hypothetical protein
VWDSCSAGNIFQEIFKRLDNITANLQAWRCAANKVLEQKFISMQMYSSLRHPVGQQGALAAAFIAQQDEGWLDVSFKCISMLV